MARNIRRPIALTSPLLIAALCLALWPRPGLAARALVTLADANQTWSQGQFFRTGYASTEIGGVQLIPRKVTKEWTMASQKLPRKLSAHSSVTYGDRIFVVGGNTFFGSTNELVKSNGVYAARLVDKQTGLLQPWATLPVMPVALAESAVVVLELNGQPFLVVLGGMRGKTDLSSNTALDDVTTGRIYAYPIKEDALGNLVTDETWRELNRRLPHTMTYEFPGATGGRGGGASGVGVTVVNVNGAPYIYTFGGQNVINNSAGYQRQFKSEVYRAAVTFDGASPVLASWEKVSDVSLVEADGQPRPVGLGNAATVTYADPSGDSTGVYLIGGLRSGAPNGATATADTNAYIATIAANGAVNWRPTGNMSQARTAHAAVQSKGQITVAAGTANLSAPEKSIARGYILDDYTLYRETELSPSFDQIDDALTQARMAHAMATLNGGSFGDWAYIMGGKVPGGAGLEGATDHILFGNLDAPVTAGDKFVPDGKYTSKIFDFGTNAKYYKFQWNVILGAGHQIEMRYRASDNRNSLGELKLMTVTSQNGANEFSFPAGTTARYIQFIATLKSIVPNTTPTLDWARLDVDRTGYPNLRVVPAGTTIMPSVITPGSDIVPSVMIANKAANGEAILEADWAGPGYFYVDIYVTPGTGAPRPTQGQPGSAYVELNKNLMGVDAEYRIPPTSWRPASCGQAPCPAVNWHNVFRTAGTYTVYVMVDSTFDPAGSQPFGSVVETDTNTPGTLGEANNVFGPFTVEVSRPQAAPKGIFLPVVMR